MWKYGAVLALLLAFVPAGMAATPDVTVESLNGQACPTGSGEYRVSVHNPGPAADRYDLSVHGPWSDATVLDDTSLRVGPGETATTYLWVRAPADAAPGDHGFSVAAASSNTGATRQGDGVVTVLSCRGVDVSLAAADPVCRGGETAARMTVTNTGQVAETFQLSTSHGTLGTDAVTLEPGASRTVDVTVQRDTAVNGTMEVAAASASSYASATASAPVTVEACRSVDVAVDAPDATCLSDGNASVTASVENTGSVADTYTVTWRGETRTVTAGAGETARLDLSLPVDEGENVATVAAASDALDAVTAEQDVTVTGETCYAVDVAAGEGRVTAEDADQTLLTVDVHNPGTRENTYGLAIDGPDWMDIRPDELTVAPGGTRPVTVYISPDFFGNGTYTAKLVANGTAVRAVSGINVSADDGTITASSAATSVTGGAVTQRSGIAAMVLTAFVLFIGGYWYFRRAGVEPEQDRPEA